MWEDGHDLDCKSNPAHADITGRCCRAILVKAAGQFGLGHCPAFVCIWCRWSAEEQRGGVGGQGDIMIGHLVCRPLALYSNIVDVVMQENGATVSKDQYLHFLLQKRISAARDDSRDDPILAGKRSAPKMVAPGHLIVNNYTLVAVANSHMCPSFVSLLGWW